MTFYEQKRKYKKTGGGFVMLYAILVTTVVLSIALSLLSVLIEQVPISGMERESSLSFYAADTGMECALYWDNGTPTPGTFVSGPPWNITCNGAAPLPLFPVTMTPSASGPPNPPSFQNWTYTFKFDTPQGGCADLVVTKTVNTAVLVGIPLRPAVASTTIQSKGYNTVCPPTASAKPWRLERGLRAQY